MTECYPKWMDEVPWRGDGVSTCVLCGGPLDGRRLQCARCTDAVVETMSEDIYQLLREETQ